MKIFFTQEIKRIPRPPSAFDDSTFWGRLVLAMDEMQRQNTLRPTPFPTRAKAFEYWLSLLPLWRQKVLLLELCSKPDFPMGRGKPTEQQRAGPTALLNNFVIDDLVILGLQVLDSAHVNTMWQKALARCASDPEGAITAARTLLESVCKHMLEEHDSSYDERADLPRLHSRVAHELGIAPSQQSERIFKQIFGGCQTVIEGVGALRNELSDAHGRGKMNVQPGIHHAAFAVNLAGAVALFLVQSWEVGQREHIAELSPPPPADSPDSA